MSGYRTRSEATSHEALRWLIRHEADWRCPMGITIQGRAEPCERNATAIVAYDFEGEWFVTPMCTNHAHRAGRGNGIPLRQILDAAGGVS